ncbi:hypothetical protein E4U60_005719 [Claviceps pazoutovae]|uniref:Uncharacterized protein n=1 Tax=Claviceps pazoutovae TaxID=1649127 RepID=A0A9P7M7M7_9HYPO|nr:hypothetical protein E4U60_005719 [Claviceps pazoutovae]
MLIAVGTRSANRLANGWYCWKVGIFVSPMELFRLSVSLGTEAAGLRVFEFHDSWEESACRPKVRGGWTGSPLRRAGIVAAALSWDELLTIGGP